MTTDPTHRALVAAHIAYRPERIFVVSDPGEEPIQWEIKCVRVVHIVDSCILRKAYAHRGRRVVGRKIRQMRRRFRRAFGP